MAERSKNGLPTPEDIKRNKIEKESRSIKKIEKRQIESAISRKLTENDDMGAQTVVAGAVVVKTAITASKATGKATIATTKTVVKVGSTTGKIVTGKIKLDKDTASKLKNKAVAKFKLYHPTAYRNIKVTKKVAVTSAKYTAKAATKTVKVIKGINATTGKIKAGEIKLDKATAVKIKNIAKVKITNTKTVKTGINAYRTTSRFTKRTIKIVRKAAIDNQYRIKLTHTVANRLKTSYHATIRNVKGLQTKIAGNAKNTLKTAVKTAETEIQLAKILTHGIKYHDRRSYLYAKSKFKHQGRYIQNTLQTSTKAVLHTQGGKIITGSLRTGVKIGKKLEKSAFKASNMLNKIDDSGAQVVGTGIKTVHYGAKLATKSIKGIKTGVRAGKGLVHAVKFTRKVGVKKATQMGAKVLGKGIKNVLKNGIKKLAAKILIPIIGIIIIIMILITVSGGLGAAIAAIFSPIFSDKDTGDEIDETEFLTIQITDARNELIEDVKDTYENNLVENGGDYHYIRFYNMYNEEPIELTDENIYDSIYSVTEYLEYIQPIFHTMLFSKYELQAKESEYQDLFEEIWDYLSVIETEELPMEYCHEGAKDKDNNIHALLMDVDEEHLKCPNPTTDSLLYHPDNASAALCLCDYYYYQCRGHRNYSDLRCHSEHHNSNCYINGVLVCQTTHSHHETCYGTYNHGIRYVDCGNSTKHLHCDGYKICGGHRILKLEITLKNFGDLLNEYFLNEMNELKSKDALTEDETKRLKQLEENYEICIEYIKILMDEYGLGMGNGTVIELDPSITLNDITSYALQFVGNKYVLGGNDPNTGADCSGFTKYVYAHFGIYIPRTAAAQSRYGQAVYSLSEAQPGDLIFFSDNGAYATHVTMYLGGNQIVHASTSKPYPKGGIKVSNIYDTIYAIRRMAR